MKYHDKGLEPDALKSLRDITAVVYVLMIISIFTGGLAAIAGVIINYIKRGEVRGSWLESHFEWQIKTFWYSLVGAIIGYFFMFVLIGIPILFAVAIWVIYRIIKGGLAFLDHRPVS